MKYPVLNMKPQNIRLIRALSIILADPFKYLIANFESYVKETAIEKNIFLEKHKP